MNYPMHNPAPFFQMTQEQYSYGQQFPNSILRPPIPLYGNCMIHPLMQNQQQQQHYNNSTSTAISNGFTSSSQSMRVNRYPQNRFQQYPNLNSRNNSFKTKDSPRLYYCETCHIACGGYKSYQAHLNGSQHKKKETGIHNQSPNPQVFQCELCDIRCTSSDAYKEHLDGTKHNKAVRLYQKLGKPIPKNYDQPLVTTNESQPIMTNGQRQANEIINEFVGTEYIKTTYDGANVPRSYYCKLCDCNFNDSNARDSHLKGKRHRLAYKKKIDLNIPVEDSNSNSNNKLLNSTENINEIVENNSNQQANSNVSSNIDQNTKYLMKLHEKIIPTQKLLDIIEQFVSATEAALKSCSDQLSLTTRAAGDHMTGTQIKSPLLGVSRVGEFVKNLLIKTDHLFHIVVVCSQWPTIELYNKIFSVLYDHFDETWKNKINILCQKDDEIIRVYTNTDEGPLSISISFTATSIQKQEHDQTLEQCLSKRICLKALCAMNSVRWFQNHISKRKTASALIRCLRYKTKISSKWQSLSSEALEILVEHMFSKSESPIDAFRQVLEHLSGGLVLSNGCGLHIPWESNEMNDIFCQLSNQERNDITYEAQNGLRFMSFGQLNKWFETIAIAKPMNSVQKRSCPTHENQISAKRQCLESKDIN